MPLLREYFDILIDDGNADLSQVVLGCSCILGSSCVAIFKSSIAHFGLIPSCLSIKNYINEVGIFVNIIWRLPSLSESTPMIFNMRLTHLCLEAFI